MDKDIALEKFIEFLNEFYYNDMISAVSENKKFILVDFANLDRFDTELADYVLENPAEALDIADESTKRIDLQAETKLKIRIFDLPQSKEVRIRNIRSEHIEKLISVDGIVKRASEVRPEVSEAIFICPECGTQLSVLQTEIFLKSPIECSQCENRKGFKQTGQKLYDARWVVIEEPFEITSGERPSDIRIFLKEDLTTPRMQNKTEPGNRKIGRAHV
jgi:replicative DNA helicase Mcm